MKHIIANLIKSTLMTMLFASMPVWALDTTVTLTADETITATSSEIVTFGLPLAAGEVLNTDEIRVLIGGVEQAIHVEAGLVWHWLDSSLRSVTIQLQNVDMTAGDIVLTITDAGRNTANDLAAVPQASGWTTAGANKGSMPFPRIFALHDVEYLASTDLIPPYVPGSELEGVGALQSGQFDAGYGDLNFPAASAGNFLFDRASAMMKAYMTTGELKFLKEGFLTKQYYFSFVKNDADPPAAPGGSGCFDYPGVACADGKYIYPQPAKLALALIGDHSQWDDALIVKMATQANLGWNQVRTDDPYSAEDEGFTERAAGIVGLAEINAWEMTGDASVLATMNNRLVSLRDMQQVEQPWDILNGWVPKSGAFTHSWSQHEGEVYPGDGTDDDRRFSPWMSENITDFLWHVYHVFEPDDTDLNLSAAQVGEMLRLLGNAIDLYGFASDYIAGSGIAATYALRPSISFPSIACSAVDRTPIHILYSGSRYASGAALNATSSDFADLHNVEVTLPLALAYYFETDPAARTRLASRIKHIQRQWLENGPGDPEDCAGQTPASAATGGYRIFNWQHRSNSLRTWEWAQDQVGDSFDEVPDSFAFNPVADQVFNAWSFSNTVNISGLGTGVSINVVTDNGVLIINGSDCFGGCSVSNGDTLAVRVLTANTALTQVTTTVSLGTAFSRDFSATTTDAALDFTAVDNANLSQDYDSNAITIDWIWTTTAVSAAGGLLLINGTPCAAGCTVDPGDQVAVRLTSSSLNSTLTSATVTLDTVVGTFNVTTMGSGPDETPDSFSFPELSGQPLSTEVTSSTITVSGLGVGIQVAASTSNGTLITNGADCTGGCTVDNGDTLAVRLTSSDLGLTTTSAVVSVGTASATFNVTTLFSGVAGTTPDAFSLGRRRDVQPSTEVTSNTALISGLANNTSVSASTSRGTLLINGQPCSSGCSVGNGDTVAVQLVSAATMATDTSANVTVGGFTVTFVASTTTGTTPDSFSFTNLIDQPQSIQVTSEAVTLSGLGPGVAADVIINNGSSGALIINGEPCTNNCKVMNGDTLAIQLTTADTGLTTVGIEIVIGAFRTNFSARTSVDRTPDAFEFLTLADQEQNTLVSSMPVTISGLGTSVTASTSTGDLLINGQLCQSACNVGNGDSLAVRLLTGSEPLSSTTAAVTVGTYSTDLTVTTNDDIFDLAVAAGEEIDNPGTLIDLDNSGVVNGGAIGGNVINSSTGVLNDVHLEPGTLVQGGTLTGEISGSGTLLNVVIDVSALSPDIQIGSGSLVTSGTAASVPGLDLTEALMNLQGVPLLDQPLLGDNPQSGLTILDLLKIAVDALFQNQDTGFQYDPASGQITILNPGLGTQIVPLRFQSVMTSADADGISVINAHGNLIVIANNIQLEFSPTAADLAAFLAAIEVDGALAAMNTSELVSASRQANGSVTLQFTDGSVQFVRFAPVTDFSPFSTDTGIAGISAQGSDADPLSHLYRINYADGTSQNLLPAIHDVAAFDSWLKDAGLTVLRDGLTGVLQLLDSSGSAVVRGIPAYSLMPTAAGDTPTSLRVSSDRNGDGILDMLFETSGYLQTIYGLP